MGDPYAPRLFESEFAVRRVAEEFCACRLPKTEWTHEAHLATTLWVIVERPDIDPERDLGDMIRRFNVSVGGVNDETQGYHETITQCFIAGIRQYLVREGEGGSLADLVNGLLLSEEGRREWPLNFYSRGLLFSVEARLGIPDPDLKPLPRTG